MPQAFPLPADAQARMMMLMENQRKAEAKLLAGEGVVSSEAAELAHKVIPPRLIEVATHETMPA